MMHIIPFSFIPHYQTNPAGNKYRQKMLNEKVGCRQPRLLPAHTGRNATGITEAAFAIVLLFSGFPPAASRFRWQWAVCRFSCGRVPRLCPSQEVDYRGLASAVRVTTPVPLHILRFWFRFFCKKPWFFLSQKQMVMRHFCRLSLCKQRDRLMMSGAAPARLLCRATRSAVPRSRWSRGGLGMPLPWPAVVDWQMPPLALGYLALVARYFFVSGVLATASYPAIWLGESCHEAIIPGPP